MARLLGNIKDGFNVGENGVLTFIALNCDSGSGLVAGSQVRITVTGGTYDFTLINGNYSAHWYDTDLKSGELLGNFTIQNNPDTDLFALVNAAGMVGYQFFLRDITDVSKEAPTIGYTLTYTASGWAPRPGGASGLPAGGTSGQALVKASNADYDVEWQDQSGGGGSGNSYFPGGWA